MFNIGKYFFFFSSIIPREYKFGYFKGMKSDGYKALAAIKRLIKTTAY